MKVFTIAFTLAAATSVFAQVAPIATDNSLQVRYVSRLGQADSQIYLTNTGATGAGTSTTGNSATVTGSICVNVYAMAPDEQELSCCSCPVTPDALVSVSARKDLLADLTGELFDSLVIKLYATAPVGGSCAGAAALSTATAAPGLAAWSTTTHITEAGLSTTETEFKPSTVSAGELNKLQSFCAFAIANGSGFGVCNSCVVGNLPVVGQGQGQAGATKKN